MYLAILLWVVAAILLISVWARLERGERDEHLREAELRRLSRKLGMYRRR